MRATVLFVAMLSMLSSLPEVARSSSRSVPDSVYLFAYANPDRGGQNGLEFAWSANGQQWNIIGDNYSELNSDYGPWGSQKRMNYPSLFRDAKGEWHCVFSLNNKEPVFAYAYSKDLIAWSSQRYPDLAEGRTFKRSKISYDESKASYIINFSDAGDELFELSTRDFKTYSPARKSEYAVGAGTIVLRGKTVEGQRLRVEYAVLQRLLEAWQARQFRNSQNAETTAQDARRFSGIKTLNAKITLKKESPTPISNMLIGAFFEDISYAADGGLYAELIQNRDFEYAPSDRSSRHKAWDAMYAWSADPRGISLTVDTVLPIHQNNKHYLRVQVTENGSAVYNAGYDGIVIRKGERYNFSMFSKTTGNEAASLKVRLVNEQNEVLASASLKVDSRDWKKRELVLTASEGSSKARLQLVAENTGVFAVDMVSLFPQKTFNGRKNGLRADLAQSIANIRPRFVRFPGGCVAHGDGLENIYDWKGSIGPLEQRKPMRNIWNYHQSRGLGYFEYFQFCEDLGAEPIPVLAAGVPCQNSGTGGNGQQGGIPMEEMGAYIQDIIDLVEYANGPATSVWGRKRAQAGHPAPFNLKYIGVGNEDLISDVFEERFRMIYAALRKAHPEIKVIGTAGPFCEGTDYREGWRIADELHIPVMDEHYYQTPGWFINNQNFYDTYRRDGSQVYLGEYAAHLPGRPNNLETALAEALYLTAIERNGDIVKMTSYAPLLAKEGHTNWNPNLIYFNNEELKTTVGYEVQKLFGNNPGQEYLPIEKWVSSEKEELRTRIACSVVRMGQTISIRLVNLTPVPVSLSLEGNGVIDISGKARITTLSGSPADKRVIPVQESKNAVDLSSIAMEPYSFKLINISK